MPDWNTYLTAFGWNMELLRLKHGALHHRERPLIGILSKTTLRSRAAPTGTLPSSPAASAWWVLPGYLLTTIPADTQSSEGSDTSDVRTPSNRVIQNFNPDFNTFRLQTIMKSIQCMVPQDSPLLALAQQVVEAVGQIVVVQPSARYHRGKPSVGNRYEDRMKRA
jgi:hypothetical protein